MTRLNSFCWFLYFNTTGPEKSHIQFTSELLVVWDYGQKRLQGSVMITAERGQTGWMPQTGRFNCFLIKWSNFITWHFDFFVYSDMKHVYNNINNGANTSTQAVCFFYSATPKPSSLHQAHFKAASQTVSQSFNLHGWRLNKNSNKAEWTMALWSPSWHHVVSCQGQLNCDRGTVVTKLQTI